MNVSKKILFLKSLLLRDWVPIWNIRSIDLEPVAACNLRCSFCQVPGWKRSSQTSPMSLDLYKQIINKIPNLQHVKLTGMGEPLLNTHLAAMVQESTQRNIHTSIVSNGMLMTKSVAFALLEAGIDRIDFSFDGGTKETYENARKGATFETVVDNVTTLCSLRKERGSDLKVGLACLVSDEKILAELPDLLHLAAKMGVDSVHVKGRLKHWSCDDDSAGVFGFSSDYVDAHKKYDVIIKDAYMIAQKYGISFTYGTTDSVAYSRKNPCLNPWYSLYVSTEGKVVPCCSIGIPESWCMGDFCTQSLNEIINGKAYRALRRQIRHHAPPQKCVACYV